MPELFGLGLGVNLFLSFVLACSMHRSGREAITVAFLGGMFLAVYSNLNFGYLPLFYVLVAYLSSLVTGDVFKNSFFLALMGFVWVMLFEILVAFSLLSSGHIINMPLYSLRVVFGSALINSGLVLVFTVLVRAYSDYLFRDQTTSSLRS